MDIFEFRQRLQSGVDEKIEDLAYRVIGAAMEVHSQLGAGLPESVYREALCHELGLRGIAYAREHVVRIVYKGKEVGFTRLDLLVEGCLIVELKSIEVLGPVHRDQCVSYLKATNLELALLINFNVRHLKEGIKRIVNTF